MSQSSRAVPVFIVGPTWRFGYRVAAVTAQFRVGGGCYGIGTARGGAK